MKDLKVLGGRELVNYLFSLDDDKEMEEVERVEDELDFRYEMWYLTKLFRECNHPRRGVSICKTKQGTYIDTETGENLNTSDAEEAAKIIRSKRASQLLIKGY